LVIGALVLFFLPDIAGIFSSGGPTATPRPTAAVATPTPEPTPIPAPTPQVYVIKSGDTLSKIARAFGLTLDELLAANKDTIEDADRITVGDEIIIPLPVPPGTGGEASASPAP
jgi:LysM repeat protein